MMIFSTYSTQEGETLTFTVLGWDLQKFQKYFLVIFELNFIKNPKNNDKKVEINILDVIEEDN